MWVHTAYGVRVDDDRFSAPVFLRRHDPIDDDRLICGQLDAVDGPAGRSDRIQDIDEQAIHIHDLACRRGDQDLHGGTVASRGRDLQRGERTGGEVDPTIRRRRGQIDFADDVAACGRFAHTHGQLAVGIPGPGRGIDGTHNHDAAAEFHVRGALDGLGQSLCRATAGQGQGVVEGIHDLLFVEVEVRRITDEVPVGNLVVRPIP